TLPAELTGALLDRWRAACAAYPPAGTFGASAARLVRHLLILPVRRAPARFRQAPPGSARPPPGSAMPSPGSDPPAAGRLMRMRIGVYECRATGIAIAARTGLIGGAVALRRRSAWLAVCRKPLSSGIFIWVNATWIDMVYLATLSSSMVLTGSGAGNVLGEP